MNTITRLVEDAQLALDAMRPVDRAAVQKVGAAGLGLLAAVWCVWWATTFAVVIALVIGVYLGGAMHEAIAAVMATLTPSSRSERRRAHRMARAAGVVIEEGSE